MIDQKPTGVFVRLPLSDEQRELMVDAASFGQPDDSHDKVLTAIGTPASGGELEVAGWCHPQQLAGLYIDNGSPEGERFVVMSRVQIGSRDIPLVRQSDAQAQIAAWDAEVVRLNAELAGYRAGLSELIAKEVAENLKGGAA